MAKFSVGEVVIIQSQDWPAMNGMETKILDSFVWIDGRKAHHCSVQLDGGGWYETSLRKKKPPKEEEFDWVELCNLNKIEEIA